MQLLLGWWKTSLSQMSGCAVFRKWLYFSEPQFLPRERICASDALNVEMLSKAWCEWPPAVKVESPPCLLVMDTVPPSRRGHRTVACSTYELWILYHSLGME